MEPYPAIVRAPVLVYAACTGQGPMEHDDRDQGSGVRDMGRARSMDHKIS